MILADKIVLLRKQCGWSQEELAEKMNVSRQSVSKWESTNSIPDLNKIIMLGEIFEVSTDSLLKDNIEVFDASNVSKENDVNQISLEQALDYVEKKIAVSALISKGVMLCVCSVVPLFFFLAMAMENRLGLSKNLAIIFGIVGILLMISVAIYYFLKTNNYKRDLSVIDDHDFDLVYGVHSVFTEKLLKYRSSYNIRLSFGIFLFIFSFVPLLVASIIVGGSTVILFMFIVMLFMISIGIYIVAPTSAKYEAINTILRERDVDSAKIRSTKRAEKLAAFYWPFLVAIYLGWSLWTMDWGVTWIIWPVGAVLFAALVGLMELLNKDEQ